MHLVESIEHTPGVSFALYNHLKNMPIIHTQTHTHLRNLNSSQPQKRERPSPQLAFHTEIPCRLKLNSAASTPLRSIEGKTRPQFLVCSFLFFRFRSRSSFSFFMYYALFVFDVVVVLNPLGYDNPCLNSIKLFSLWVYIS